MVSFLNFKNWLAEQEVTRINQYISVYRYTDVETKEELGDGTNLIFIDLYSFCKKPNQCTDMQDWWMYSLKNMFNMTECPPQILGTEVEDLFTQSELARMTLEQRLKIEESIMTENDIRNSIAEQIEDGIAAGLAEREEEVRKKGREEGREEGEQAKAREIATKLLARGLSRAEIAAIVGIKESEL